MKKRPQRAILSKPDPIIVKIDPMMLRSGIVLPKVKYEVVATMDSEQVFQGMVLPIPKVLIYFLNRNEMLVMTTILEASIDTGDCAFTTKELSKKIHITLPTLTAALYSLRKIGLLLEQPNGNRGNGRIRKLNYEAIQHLNDLVEGEDVDVFVRIRKATKKVNIMNLTKSDIHNAYDNYALPPDHDPAEEEEYD